VWGGHTWRVQVYNRDLGTEPPAGHRAGGAWCGEGSEASQKLKTCQLLDVSVFYKLASQSPNVIDPQSPSLRKVTRFVSNLIIERDGRACPP